MSIPEKIIPGWLSVSRETLTDLGVLESLVLRWNSTVNLISRSTVLEIWNRHVLDSAQIAKVSVFPAGLWADLGSGGGFPGLVLAVQAKHEAPQTEFVLVESDVRKAAFLRDASRQLSLRVRVVTTRIEQAPRLSAQMISARALAPLVDLLSFADQHLVPGGRAFFLKGARFADEITAAERKWQFDHVVHKSRTDSDAAILEVSNIEAR